MKVLAPFLALYRRHRWRLSLGIVLAIVTLLASIGLLTLSGWFLAASSLAGFAGLYTFNYMLPAAGVRGAAVIRTAARYFERLVSHDGTFRVLEHLRVFTFSKLMPLSPAGLRHYQQGDLLNRLVADVDTLDHLYLRVIAPLAGAIITLVVVTLGLSWLNIPLALTTGGIMLLTVILLPPLFYRAGRPAGENLTRLRGEYRTWLTRWLRGQAELALYGAEPALRQQLDQTEAAWLLAQQRQASLTGFSAALLTIITGFTVLLVLWLAAADAGHSSSSGALIALFVFCTLAAFEALAPVSTAFQHLGQVIASAQRVAQLIAQPPAVTFNTRSVTPFTCASLQIRDLDFHYETGNPVFQRLSLTVAHGEHVALLGRTGCGKSTLLQLLTRAWDPQHGEITLNGMALNKIDESSLRAATSVVTQRVHLFSATLRDNLLLSAPTASDEKLCHALCQVGLHTLLDDQQGLNAWLGEGGRQLSGGERRRLAIARALLHNGNLLLLDEPTEGLDAETEQAILLLLHEVARNKTLIMVTHRLTGLRHFDKICVMDRGCIVEQGEHTELLAKRGRYWYFHQQFTL